MSLPLTVALVAFAFMIVVGVIAKVIDSAEEKYEGHAADASSKAEARTSK